MPESDQPLIPHTFERALYQVAPLASLHLSVGDIRSLHAGLVLQTVDQLGAAPNPEEIRAAIGRLGIALSPEDVLRAIGALVEDGRLQQAGDHRVRIPEELRSQLAAAARDASLLKRTVVGQWLKALDSELIDRSVDPLSGSEAAFLEADLDIFLLQTVRYNGAELVAFLYPDAKTPRAALDINEAVLFRELPPREDRLEAIRRNALPAFVREARAERAAFLADLLHRAFLVEMLQADASASSLFADVMLPMTVYLDTNFVFRVLGLQGRLLKEASLDVLRLGKSMGHSFRISRRTFDELTHSVRRQLAWLAERPNVPQPLAEVAADFVAGNDYVSAYWRDRGIRGVSIDQFRQTYAQLSLLLENEDIEITNVRATEIAGSSVLREAITALRLLKPFDSPEVVEHDAFHKVLIEQLRLDAHEGLEPQGWHELSIIFLTVDHQLPVLAMRMATQGKAHRIPFCLMANEWLQILYFLRRDSTISATTLVSLLNSPYLQSYFSQRAVNRDIVQSIMATMGEVGELRPQVARKMLVNRVLLRTLEASADSANRERLLKAAIAAESRAEDKRLADLIKLKDDEIARLNSDLTRQATASRDTLSKPARKTVASRTRLREAEEERRRLRKMEAEAREYKELAARAKQREEAVESKARVVARLIAGTLAWLVGLFVISGAVALLVGHPFHTGVIGTLVAFAVLTFVSLELVGIFGHVSRWRSKMEVHISNKISAWLRDEKQDRAWSSVPRLR